MTLLLTSPAAYIVKAIICINNLCDATYWDGMRNVDLVVVHMLSERTKRCNISNYEKNDMLRRLLHFVDDIETKLAPPYCLQTTFLGDVCLYRCLLICEQWSARPVWCGTRSVCLKYVSRSPTAYMHI